MSDAVRVSPAWTRSEELQRELEPAIAAPAAVPLRDDSDKGWTVPAIAKAFDVHPETIYRQIEGEPCPPSSSVHAAHACHNRRSIA